LSWIYLKTLCEFSVLLFSSCFFFHVNHGFSCSTSIEPLRTLNRLETLDLHANRLTTLDSLSPIQNMNWLRSLKVAGNPLCISYSVPVQIFQLQQALETVDCWVLDTRTNNVVPLVPSPPQGSGEEVVVSHERLHSLELQLRLVSDSLEMMEENLSQDASKQCQDQLNDNLFLNKLLSEHNNNNNNQTTIDFSQEVPNKFPYYQVLQAWRKQFLKMKFQNILLTRQMKDLYDEKKNERAKQEQKLKALDVENYTLKNKVKFSAEQNLLFTNDMIEKERQLEREQSCNQEIYSTLVNYQTSFSILQNSLEKFQATSTSQELLFNSLCMKGIEKMKNYEKKLAKATDDLVYLKEFLQFRELQLRNSQALLQMEREILDFQKNSDQQQSLPLSSSSSSSSIPMELSDLSISPATESFLKTVFHSLDFQQNGLISVQSLLLFFLDDDEEEEREEKQDEGNEEENNKTAVDFHWNGNNYKFTVMAPLLMKSMENNNDNNNNNKSKTVLKLFLKKLHELLERDLHSDLSWGELLFLFVPFPSGDHLTIPSLSLSSSWLPCRSSKEQQQQLLSRKEKTVNNNNEEVRGRGEDQQEVFLRRQQAKSTELAKIVFEKEILALESQKKSAIRAKESAEEQLATLTDQLLRQKDLFSKLQKQSDEKSQAQQEEILQLRELVGNQQTEALNQLRKENEKLQVLYSVSRKEKDFIMKQQMKAEAELKRFSNDMKRISDEKDERLKLCEQELLQEKLNHQKITLTLEERVEELQRKLSEANEELIQFQEKEINEKQSKEKKAKEEEEKKRRSISSEKTAREEKEEREMENERRRRGRVSLEEEPTSPESGAEQKRDSSSASISYSSNPFVPDSLKRFSQIKNSLDKLIAESR
jgi:hypothetical protein